MTRSSSEKESLIHKNGSYGSTNNDKDADNNGYLNYLEDPIGVDDEDTRIRSFQRGGGTGGGGGGGGGGDGQQLKNNLRNSLTQSIGKSARALRDSLASHPGFPASIRDMGGTSTMSNEIFNLIKNLIGAGAFGMPQGVASLAGGSSTLWAMVPAGFIIVLFAVLFGYYFVLVGRVCKMTYSASYREAWDKSAGSVGGAWGVVWKKISFLIPLSIILMAGIGNLAYGMILADATKSLVERFGVHVSRTVCLLVVTVVVLLPLCLVKKLSALAVFSAVGTGGMVFTLLVMGLRLFDGSYDKERDGRFLDTPHHLRPSFTNDPLPPQRTNTLLLSCMSYMAFFCHYNSPRYYTELKRNTIPRFSTVISVSFASSALVYFAIGIFGYYTFGRNVDGFVLNNYSANDDLASVCRFAIAISLAFTYPFCFIGTRDGILDLFSVPADKQTSTNLNLLTVAMIVVFTVMAWHFTDLGLINAVGGGALATALVFVFPSIMLYCAVKNMGNEASFWLKVESVAVFALMVFGILMGVVGVIVVTTGVGQ